MIIKEFSPIIGHYKRSNNFSNDNFEQWLKEEANFLAKSKAEPEIDAQQVAYVEVLEKFKVAR
jgi:hypothetical protein